MAKDGNKLTVISRGSIGLCRIKLSSSMQNTKKNKKKEEENEGENIFHQNFTGKNIEKEKKTTFPFTNCQVHCVWNYTPTSG